MERSESRNRRGDAGGGAKPFQRAEQQAEHERGAKDRPDDAADGEGNLNCRSQWSLLLIRRDPLRWVPDVLGLDDVGEEVLQLGSETPGRDLAIIERPSYVELLGLGAAPEAARPDAL